MKKIAIFASGSGSNAQRIIEFFTNSTSVKVEIILSNKSDAFVLERAAKFKIPSKVFTRQEFYESDDILSLLIDLKIDLIVLAGFLWLVPNNLLKQYPNRIVNIHPALLPKYGGKGMYGSKVHEAVIANKDAYSGITIHFINDKYDEGDIIAQHQCHVMAGDTPNDLAQRIHQLEYEYFPKVIDEILKGL